MSSHKKNPWLKARKWRFSGLLKCSGHLYSLHKCLMSTPSSTLIDGFSLNEHPVANEFLSLITCCQSACMQVFKVSLNLPSCSSVWCWLLSPAIGLMDASWSLKYRGFFFVLPCIPSFWKCSYDDSICGLSGKTRPLLDPNRRKTRGIFRFIAVPALYPRHQQRNTNPGALEKLFLD